MFGSLFFAHAKFAMITNAFVAIFVIFVFTWFVPIFAGTRDPTISPEIRISKKLFP